MNMLEAIRATGLSHSVKFYQASTSELYGKVQQSHSDKQSSIYQQQFLDNYTLVIQCQLHCSNFQCLGINRISHSSRYVHCDQ